MDIPGVRETLDAILFPFKILKSVIVWLIDGVKQLWDLFGEDVTSNLKSGAGWFLDKLNPLSTIKKGANWLVDIGSKASPINANAQAIQSQQISNSRSVDNSRSINQQAHIDKVIVNNPGGNFTETMSTVIGNNPIMSSIQDDRFTG